MERNCQRQKKVNNTKPEEVKETMKPTQFEQNSQKKEDTYIFFFNPTSRKCQRIRVALVTQHKRTH